MTATPCSLTKKSNDWWGLTILNSASCPKYRGDPYPPGWHKTLPKLTQTSTLWYSGVSSTQSWRPPNKKKTSTRWRSFSLKKHSVTCIEPVQQHEWPTQSTPLKRPCPAIKKTGGKSTSTCPAKMGNDVLPNGSSRWTEERWPGTPRTTHQGTSPSLLTFMPQKSIMMTMMTPQE